MRKFKKALAFALASAMIVSVVPVSAATSNTAKAGKSTIYYNGNKDYKSTWVKTTTKKGYTTKFFNQNAKIATLDKKTGKVTAKAAGTAQVKVNFYKSGKYVGNKIVKISIKKAPVARGIKLENATLNVGETTNVVTSNGVKVNCYSADKSIVTVNKTTGKVTAVAPGTTKIAVRNAYTSKKVYVDVTVNAEFGVKQTGAKQITVTGNNFTKDTKVEVKRGNTVVDIDAAKTKVASDGRTIVLTTKSTISAAEYTVTAGDKTAKFTGEVSKVTTLEVSDEAVALADTTLPVAAEKTAKGTSPSAIIAYRVKNQFGEDVTKSTTVQANASRTTESSPSQGEFKVKLNLYDKVGDVISVVFIQPDTGLSVSKNVTLSNASSVNEVTVKGLYNESKKTLTEDVTENELNEFYLLLDVKDQYGKSMAKKGFKTGNDLQNDSLVVSPVPGVTNVTLKSGEASIKKVDGTDYVAIPLALVDGKKAKDINAGTVSVAMFSKLGKTFNGTFEVAAGAKIDTFTASPANTVVAGAETVFDFTAIDTYGNDISEKATKDMFAETTTSTYFDASKETYFKFAKNAKTGKNELIFVDKRTSATTDLPYVASFITATNKPVTIQFTIKANSTPKVIETQDNIGIIAKGGREATLDASDVKVTDQYGNAYKFAKFGVEENGYTLEIVGGGSDITLSGTDEATATFKSNGTKAATETFTLNLKDKDKKIVSTETFTVSTKALNDVVTSASDINVKDIPAMYLNTENGRELTVKAKINGADVTLKAGDDYVVYTNGDSVAHDTVSTSAIKLAPSEQEKENSYTVVIRNNDGTSITKTTKISKVAPKAATAEVKDSVNGKVAAGTITAAEILKGLTVKDQYGLEMKDIASTVRVAFSDYADAEKQELKLNNTTDASIKLDAGQSVTATLTFDGGFTFTTSVTAK